MDVPVHLKPRQRWLRSPKTPSVLGGGLLERARSTTLALLGVTTAVGLAMVALALNQSWPLVPDSPIPGSPAREAAIGKATVAAQARASVLGSGLAGADRAASPDANRAVRGGGAGAPPAGSPTPGPAELVVAPSAPAGPQGDAPRGSGEPTPPSSPAGETPQPPATPIPASETTQAQTAPPSPPVVETAPPPTSAEAPVESSDDDWDDDEDDWDDEDEWDGGGWHDHDNGHHWSHGHHDD
jgi:hypothetical protein